MLHRPRSSQGNPTRLPAEAQWFVLDEEVGEETLYLIATTRPLDSANVIQLLTSETTETAIRRLWCLIRNVESPVLQHPTALL